MMKKYRSYIIISIIIIVFYTLNVLTPECTDDYSYKFVFVKGAADSTIPVITFADFLNSQVDHYLYHSGRVVCAALFQLFAVFLGKDIFNLCNTLIFTYFVFLAFRFSNLQKTVSNYLIVLCGILFLLPIFKETFLWMIGSLAYLWPATIVCAILLIQERKERVEFAHKEWLLLPIGIIAGLTHEGLSFPLALAFGTSYLLHYKKAIRTAAFPIVLGFVIGAFACVFSPSIFSRVITDEGQSLLSKLINGIYWLPRLRAFYVMVAFLLYYYHNNKEVFHSAIQRNEILLLAIFFTFGILFLSGFDSERTAFGTEFFSLLCLLRILPEVKMPKPIVRSAYLLLSLFLFAVFFYSYLNYQEDQYELAQIKSGNTIVSTYKIDIPVIVDDFVLSNGNYIRYNASSEFNQCEAATYGVSSLSFLPDFVVEDMKSGVISERFSVPTKYPFYIKTYVEGESNTYCFSVEPSQLASFPIFGSMERFAATEVPVRADVISAYNQKFVVLKRNDLIDIRVNGIILKDK